MSSPLLIHLLFEIPMTAAFFTGGYERLHVHVFHSLSSVSASTSPAIRGAQKHICQSVQASIHRRYRAMHTLSSAMTSRKVNWSGFDHRE